MAIQFARCQYVSRSSGGNACRKAAYNGREAIKCERTGELFYFKHKDDSFYHEVLLPQGADEKFKNSRELWNAAENAERRKDSQVAREFVIALPDDKELSQDDRVELSKGFAHKYFVDKGVAVQVDIHEPHDGEKNWHAHMLVTTRRFSEDGKSFHKLKARDLDPEIRNRNVIEADIWGELWRDFQNEYFKEKGLDIRVDPIGIVPQEHLGPVRMRQHMNDAIERSELLKEANESISRDPEGVISSLSRSKAVFSEKDIETYIEKHTPEKEQVRVFKETLTHSTLLRLYCKETKEFVGYTTRQARADEQRLIRFASNIERKESRGVGEKIKDHVTSQYSLSEEQKVAFDKATTASNLSIIQGRAGVGKSYILKPIREAYEELGYKVLGLTPTNKLARDMASDGFKEATTCHAFLFALKNGRTSLKEDTLVVLDEASMVSTPVFIELFHVVKSHGAKILLVGDERQLSSIERGGMFKILAERFGSSEIVDVRRQEIDWQKQLSLDLSQGRNASAISILDHNDRLHWKETKEEAMSALITQWEKDSLFDRTDNRFILAQRNVDVDSLNFAIREIRKGRGEIGLLDFEIETLRGPMNFSVGDRIQFTLTDKNKNLLNGEFGTLKLSTEDHFIVEKDNGEKVQIDPSDYKGLRHGYAGTIYKAQGSTIEHTYILHGKNTNQNNSYVALTRQSKDLHVFISKEETKDKVSLLRQISREDNKVATLNYLTEKELLRTEQKEEWLLNTKNIAQEKIEALWNTVKDAFHENKGFYDLSKDSKNISREQKVDERFLMEENTTEDIIQNINQRLSIIFEATYGRLPNEKEVIFQEKQAEKATLYFIEHKERTGKDPSRNEAAILVLRAAFELKREEIHKEDKALLIACKKTIKSSDYLHAHIYAERLALIEGRLYEEELRKTGIVKNEFVFKDIAQKELDNNLRKQKDLSDLIQEKHSLSEDKSAKIAILCTRYMERTGVDPTAEQLTKFVQIATYIENRTEILSEKYLHESKEDRTNITQFLIAYETNSLLRERKLDVENQEFLHRIQEKSQVEMQNHLQQAQVYMERSKGRDI